MFRQVVWCRKHKAGNKAGFYTAKEKPSKAPFKLQKSSEGSTALPKGHSAVTKRFLFLFFCFKYQNYKNQFINCFSKTTTKTKQSPRIKAKQNTVKSV